MDKSSPHKDPRSDGSQDSLDSLVSSFTTVNLNSETQSSRRPDCRNGLKCFNIDCSQRYRHPTGWNPCEDGKDCEDFNCEAIHPYNRKKPCRDGHRCSRYYCHFLHPVFHANACSDGTQCRSWTCEKWHPKQRRGKCRFSEACYNIECQNLHPPGRKPCPNGVECDEFDCELDHPHTRKNRCDQGNACGNFFCVGLHPRDWDPCDEGSECDNADCPHAVHPLDRDLSKKKNEQNNTQTSLKSLDDRQRRREKASLPILSIKDEFCQRLENERILVVTAETGSGKTTQLPQYAAEYFGGLVVCTQPRVIAAISLARRVAEEYDGTSVGQSVGYRVGHSSVGKDKNRVPGTDIIFMTDGTFIQESQLNREMTDIRVLIIDEAHERSLNTDIVMGIARQLLNTRPKDFYVVICSATINADKFLQFFQQTDVRALQVEGRVYPVESKYIGKSKEPIANVVVSTVLRLYDQHKGNILVFLSGQSEIENAIELFKRKAPNHCIALPLYSTLSPEEQDLVLRFDAGLNSEKRMVVFCTNIAETSLTIDNVQLVIDSGLVYQSHYDYEDRIRIIESKMISSASASQRKGRAGRTAPGCCVHLYDEKDLICSDTEPQILRDSLDLVVLQLVSSDLNPLEFPFMDPPDQKNIQASLDLLKNLSCIDETGIINERGKLFAKLGVDPRYSALLLDTYLEHEPILELAAIIVAICIAPGDVFSINGESKEEKASNLDRIALNAHKFESDLFYMVEEYQKWFKSAMIDSDTRICPTCGKTYARGYACGPCRAAYSRTHLLNNKILNYVESMSDEFITILKDPRWQLSPGLLPDANESAIIGAKLFKYFHERHGCITLSPHRGKTNYIINGNLHARLSDTSAFFGEKPSNTSFIATSLAKVPGGAYKIDRLHPFSPPSDTSQDKNTDKS